MCWVLCTHEPPLIFVIVILGLFLPLDEDTGPWKTSQFACSTDLIQAQKSTLCSDTLGNE